MWTGLEHSHTASRPQSFLQSSPCLGEFSVCVCVFTGFGESQVFSWFRVSCSPFASRYYSHLLPISGDPHIWGEQKHQLPNFGRKSGRGQSVCEWWVFSWIFAFVFQTQHQVSQLHYCGNHFLPGQKVSSAPVFMSSLMEVTERHSGKTKVFWWSRSAALSLCDLKFHDSPTFKINLLLNSKIAKRLFFPNNLQKPKSANEPGGDS